MVNKNRFDELREKAEKLAKEIKEPVFDIYLNDVEKLTEELNIHHIELEMQNKELQEANHKILEEQNRFKALYFDAPIPYFILNETGNIIMLNHAAALLLQLPIHKFTFTSIFPYLSEEYKVNFSKFIKQVFESEKIEFGELAFVDSNKNKVYVNLSAVCYFDTELKTKLIRCTAIDKTKDKQYENEIALRKQLEKSEKKFSQLFYDSCVVMLVVNPHTGKIENANNRATEFYGYTLNELKVMHLNDLMVENQSFKENKKKDWEQTYLTQHKLSNGEIRYVEVFRNKVKSGSFEMLFLIINDITAEREAQHKIFQLNNRLESSMMAGNMAWWEMELPSGKIQFNENKTKMLGYNVKDFVHYQDFMRLVHPHDNEPAMQAMRNHLEGKLEVYEVEYRIRNSNNEYLWFHDIGRITHKSEKKLVLTGIVMDVTERKKVLAEIKNQKQKIEKANAELHEANATKDKFFSIIAHDLKNPFNAILGYTELLKRNLEKYDTTKIKSMVDIIFNSSEATYKLLENLLEWSRTKRGKINFSPKGFTLNSLLKTIIMQNQSYSKAKQLSIINRVDDNFTVFADNNMLNTILRNLIGNALKYTRPGGQVEITTTDAINYVTIQIKDTGVGMSTETISNLFTIDKINSTDGTNNEKGTGLGLLLCKEFVDIHKGKIWAESDEGEGTSFYVELPKQ